MRQVGHSVPVIAGQSDEPRESGEQPDDWVRERRELLRKGPLPTRGARKRFGRPPDDLDYERDNAIEEDYERKHPRP